MSRKVILFIATSLDGFIAKEDDDLQWLYDTEGEGDNGYSEMYQTIDTTIPLSLAYAIWSGIGTAATALIGVLLWEDPFSIITLVGLVLIIGGVIFLSASDHPEATMKPSS